MKNDKGDGTAPTAKAARWRTISRHQTVWYTLVGTTTNRPVLVMQAHLMQLYSAQIAP